MGWATLEMNQSLPHVQTTLSGSRGVTPFITKTNNLSQFCAKSVELLAQRAAETYTLPQEGTGGLAQRFWNQQGLARQLEHCVQTEEGQGGVPQRSDRQLVTGAAPRTPGQEGRHSKRQHGGGEASLACCQLGSEPV